MKRVDHGPSGSPRTSGARPESIRCAVVGASGYAGAELVSLLAAHPRASIVSVHADGSAGARWEDLHPGRAHLYRGEIQPFDADALAGLDVVSPRAAAR
jgi:N-acetyl-gamma-glutamyl-phosphate reductase